MIIRKFTFFLLGRLLPRTLCHLADKHILKLIELLLDGR